VGFEHIIPSHPQIGVHFSGLTSIGVDFTAHRLRQNLAQSPILIRFIRVYSR
jgi:hypothetical protein